MDLRTRRIANEWIIYMDRRAGYTAHPLWRRGAVFFFKDAFPDTRTLHSVLFFICWAREISNSIRCWRLFSGVPAILKCMDCVVPVSSGLIYPGIILVCGNLPQRLTKFFNYFQTYFTKKENTRKQSRFPCTRWKWGMESHPFSVPVLMGVLLWIGGFY